MKHYSNFEKVAWVSLLAFLALFASIRVIGLQPDAALYAGLAQKILHTDEWWMLAGTAEKFPKFFEHPPYFMQWGAWLMSKVGVHEWSARAMGAIPSFAGLMLLVGFVWRKWGWSVAAWTLFAVATTGHFTKYAATSMLEGPVALGVLLAALGTYLYLYAKRNYIQLLGILLMGLGIAIACAIKGVIGLGAWGGCMLAVFIHFFIENKPIRRLFYLPFLALSLLFLGALPFFVWVVQAVRQPALLEWLHGYFVQQVFRSATTDRGEAFFSEAHNYFYYIQTLVRNVWPWWWTIPATLVLSVKGPERFRGPLLRSWILVSLSFFFSFLIPLSLVSYKLPHYMHPTYLLLAPLAGFFLDHLSKKFLLPRFSWIASPWVRWVPLLVAAAVMWLPEVHVSKSSNRGQEFVQVRAQINEAPARCHLVVPREAMDPYRMEAFALWYFEGREWRFSEQRYPSQIAVPQRTIYWDPSQERLWAAEGCAR